MARLLKQALLALVLVALAWLGGRAIYRALASPATKIRWRLEEMVEGFDASRAQPVLDGLEKGFVDRVAGVTREDVHATLAWMYLNEVDERGRFLWDAELAEDELAIVVAPDERTAAVQCRVRFFRRRGEEPELEWDARVAGTVALGEDGWKWTEVTTANHEERSRR